jgi:hypothetical protein
MNPRRKQMVRIDMKNLADLTRQLMYRPRMNIEQSKSIPLEELLLRLGIAPSRKSRDQLWYLSPLRSESTASFKVNTAMNSWYDFGAGEGGDIIDLIKKIDGLNSVSEALARIKQLMGSSTLPVRIMNSKDRKEATQAMELTHIDTVQAKSLLAYLKSRGIDSFVVAPYVKEAYYRRDNDSYFALAFANNSGGFELRSPQFKGTLGAKDITTMAGDPSRVLVFEGFFDFLTAVMLNDGLPDATIIVLNSVSMRTKAIDAIRNLSPRCVELYRDCDAAGEQLVEAFRTELPNVELVDKSSLYAGSDDLNDWYTSIDRTKASQSR